MDCKERLLLDYKTALLANGANPDIINKFIDTLVLQLIDYDLQPMNKSLALNDNRNAMLIRGFIATLLTEGKSCNTTKVYTCILNRFQQEVGKPLNEVTSYDIRLWIATQEQRISLATCENYRAYLSSFYQWMMNEEIITQNPMGKIKPIKYTDAVKLPFDSIDLDKLRTACQTTRERAILETLLSCGARVSELCALNRNDIDFNTRRVLIRKGKGNKQRTVYISDVCKNHIQRYLLERKDNDEQLFNTSFNRRVNNHAIERLLQIIGERANVDNVHPHRCRRTFATELARHGMPVQEIQHLMGHADINVTMRYITLDDTTIEISYRKCS